MSTQASLALMFCGALFACAAFGALGVYLMVNDFPVMGGIVLVMALLCLGSVEVKSKPSKCKCEKQP